MSPLNKISPVNFSAADTPVALRSFLAFLVACTLLCWTSNSISAESMKADASELNRLQGKWERELTDANAKAGLWRVIKEVKGDKETVAFYGVENKLERKQTAQFKLDKNGDLHVFTYFNLEVTDGDGAGTKRPLPVSYIYRVDQEYFFEVTGLLPGQTQQPVTVFRWKRVKN